MAKAGRVFVEPVSEPLVGHVDKGKEAIVSQRAGKESPLRGVEVGACRIVAAAVKQDDVTGRHLANCFQHVREPDLARRRVEIGICVDPETGSLRDGTVIWPGRLRKMDRATRPRFGEEFGDDAKCAGSARGLNRANSRFVVCVAECQPGDRRVEPGVAFGPEVGLGRLRREHACFRRLHGSHDGSGTGRILVDTDAKITLFLPRVVAEHCDQREDLVRLRWRERFEHRPSPFSGRHIQMHLSAPAPACPVRNRCLPDQRNPRRDAGN